MVRVDATTTTTTAITTKTTSVTTTSTSGDLLPLDVACFEESTYSAKASDARSLLALTRRNANEDRIVIPRNDAMIFVRIGPFRILTYLLGLKWKFVDDDFKMKMINIRWEL